MDNLEFSYTFDFENGPEKHFTVMLHPEELTLENRHGNDVVYPDWVDLVVFKCPNCPLDEREQRTCPVAYNISELVSEFKDYVSYERVHVHVSTPRRDYHKETSLQEGLSSLIGIYMVSSGCPHFEQLKPMVRFHTPFATDYETAYRAISMYLTGQYFRKQWGRTASWDLTGLRDVYREIRVVNKNIIRKFQELKQKDANINALVNLDCFANTVEFSIDNSMLEELEVLFKPYDRD